MKAGCHLCEEVEAELSKLRLRYPHQVHAVDITADRDLLERYGDRIPVLLIEGREYSAPLRSRDLEAALRAGQEAQVRGR